MFTCSLHHVCQASFNKDLETAVLLSDKVYQRLPEELRHRTTIEGVHHVKGREDPVGVFSIR